jgi:hypothetical protein
MINIRNSIEPLRNAPVNLRPEEEINPYLVVEWFFWPAHELIKNRRRLEKWLLYAIDTRNNWTRNKLVNCIHKFGDMACLLEALWLIHKRGDRFTKAETLVRGTEDNPYYVWSAKVKDSLKWNEKYTNEDFCTWSLTEDEEKNPFQAVDLFFEKQDLFDAKEKLDWWCRTAVSNNMDFELMDRKIMVEFHDDMVRILEAAFIIAETKQLIRGD